MNMKSAALMTASLLQCPYAECPQAVLCSEHCVERAARAVDAELKATDWNDPLNFGDPDVYQRKQRVKLIEHDPNECRPNGSKQQNREATSTTDPESEQWWEDEEDDTETED